LDDERWRNGECLPRNAVLTRARNNLDATRLRRSVIAGSKVAERDYGERKTRDTHDDSKLGGTNYDNEPVGFARSNLVTRQS
jgi:hypothetical protein